MSDAQQIAEDTVDSIINLHAANPNRSRAELAAMVGLRKTVEALEKGENLILDAENLAMAADGPVTPTSRAMNFNDLEECLRCIYRALAALKGEKA